MVSKNDNTSAVPAINPMVKYGNSCISEYKTNLRSYEIFSIKKWRKKNDHFNIVGLICSGFVMIDQFLNPFFYG